MIAYTSASNLLGLATNLSINDEYCVRDDAPTAAIVSGETSIALAFFTATKLCASVSDSCIATTGTSASIETIETSDSVTSSAGGEEVTESEVSIVSIEAEVPVVAIQESETDAQSFVAVKNANAIDVSPETIAAVGASSLTQYSSFIDRFVASPSKLLALVYAIIGLILLIVL